MLKHVVTETRGGVPAFANSAGNIVKDFSGTTAHSAGDLVDGLGTASHLVDDRLGCPDKRFVRGSLS